MSRKRRAPKRKNYSDPKYGSLVISKFINSIMYDGKRSTAERILYGALDKIKSKNEDPVKVFNSAISNVRVKKTWPTYIIIIIIIIFFLKKKKYKYFCVLGSFL